jgi:hypothetical protein
MALNALVDRAGQTFDPRPAIGSASSLWRKATSGHDGSLSVSKWRAVAFISFAFVHWSETSLNPYTLLVIISTGSRPSEIVKTL